MVYCRYYTTHSQAVDSTEGCVATRGIGNCNEIGIITYKRQWRNGIGLDAVGFFNDSTRKTYKRKGET
jgi:hypothetical protein